MDKQLTRDEINTLVENLARAFQHDECGTCDCFQGFLTQLELDHGEGASDITRKYKPAGKRMHGCLGCDPCPPGAAFAEYLRRIQKERESTGE